MPRTLLPPSMEDNECPITQVPRSMLDIPVINKVDGMHYEYAPICLWVETHGTSPVTREKTQVSDLVAENDLWFVLDTSGSMSQPATSLHISETTNLSINDLAVYSDQALEGCAASSAQEVDLWCHPLRPLGETRLSKAASHQGQHQVFRRVSCTSCQARWHDKLDSASQSCAA